MVFQKQRQGRCGNQPGVATKELPQVLYNPTILKAEGVAESPSTESRKTFSVFEHIETENPVWPRFRGATLGVGKSQTVSHVGYRL